MGLKQVMKSMWQRCLGMHVVYRTLRFVGVHMPQFVTVSDARQRLQDFSPNPDLHYTYPSFCYDNPDMDLSIIVPAFNVEKYIGECLESILMQQTKYSMEVIVINDGSTDGTLSVIRKFAERDNRVRVLDGTNHGAAACRNRGIDESRGAALMFVDADDRLMPGYVEHYMHALEKSGADYVTGRYRMMDDSGKVDSSKSHGHEDMGSPWGRVYWRYVWHDIRFPEGYMFEDTVLAFAVEPRYHEDVIDDAGYLWRAHPGSQSHSGESPKVVDAYWILEYMMQMRSALNLSMTDDIKLLLLFQCSASMFWHIRLLPAYIQHAVFVAAGELLKYCCVDGSRVSVSPMANDAWLAFQTGNFRLWQIVSCLWGLSGMSAGQDGDVR